MKWLALALSLICSSAQAQIGLPFPGPGTAHSAGGYQGIGDLSVSAGTPKMWGSCARVFQASLASTSTSLCDLVDSAAPTVTICTLRGTSSGFVDLAGAYCTGSVTPATKCAAATGGVCNVSKVYDQIGGTAGWTQATAASQFVLTFSVANGLPGMTVSGTELLSGPSFALAQPYSVTAVYKRTSGTTFQTIIGTSGSSQITGPGNSANLAAITTDTSNTLSVAATDNALHAYNATAGTTTANSLLNVDGTTTSGNAGITGATSQASRLGRGNACCELLGVIMEAGVWATTGLSVGDQTAINSNQHGTSGYNF